MASTPSQTVLAGYADEPLTGFPKIQQTIPSTSRRIELPPPCVSFRLPGSTECSGGAAEPCCDVARFGIWTITVTDGQCLLDPGSARRIVRTLADSPHSLRGLSIVAHTAEGGLQFHGISGDLQKIAGADGCTGNIIESFMLGGTTPPRTYGLKRVSRFPVCRWFILGIREGTDGSHYPPLFRSAGLRRGTEATHGLGE